MRVEEATDLLKRVQFEKFTIEVGLVATEAYSGSANVQFQIKAVNSYRPDDPPMELSMGGEVPHYVRTSEDFYDWCLGHLIWFAEHETREWFKVGGRPWRDPHERDSQQPFYKKDTFDRVVAMRPKRFADGWGVADRDFYAGYNDVRRYRRDGEQYAEFRVY